MNKMIILLTIMLFFSAADIFSQETYKPLLTEGKSWQVVTTNTTPIDHEDEVSYIKLCADTIISGHTCKILVHSNNEYTRKSILWEDDKTIYKYDENTKTFLPLMDFNLHKGDKVGDWGLVLSEDNVEVNNIVYRRLGIGYEGDAPLVYWVEGIGASKDYWITLFDTHIGEYSYMQECRKNGESIFVQDDFYKGECLTYLPVLTEGRMWKLSFTDRDTWQDLPNIYMTITVDGDSIVDGRRCKKLLVDCHNMTEEGYPKYIVAHESNGRVYRIDEDGEEHLVMDMSFHKGDVFNDINVVLKDDYMVVNGIKRKWLMIDSGVDHTNDKYLYYMVEGIGLSKDEFISIGLGDEHIYFHRLIACYDNGKCIFSATDLPRGGIANGLIDVNVVGQRDNTLYDIQGRKRSGILRGEIYIQNGRKYTNH